MNASPVIPRPWRHRWNDFRLRGIPPIILLATVAAIVALWNRNWMPSTFIGEVQAPAATIASPRVGLLTEVHVSQFAPVHRGQTVAVVRVVSPDVLQASASAIKADLEVMRARMALDQQRNNQNYDRFRLDWLSERVDLATARANLRFTENELTRAERLHRDGILSDSELEAAEDRRDELVAEVEERTRLVNELEQIVLASQPAELPEREPRILEAVDSAIAAHEAELRELESPIQLQSPIDGTVTAVLRRAGETVMAGEPLILISGSQAEQIIGYVRQPLHFEPKTGDTVQVRTRGPRRQVGMTRVSAVGDRFELYAVSTAGSQIELFVQPLGLRPAGARYERGLPVLLDIPANMRLIPGELVDLIVRSSD
jgi:multidrug resistance efflux pump